MKMKKYFKAVCMALVFCFLVSYAMPVTNVEAAQARTILRYPKVVTSDSGLLQVHVSLSVQDSVEEIIGYQITSVYLTNSNVTDVEILDDGLDMNNTRVYIHFRYLLYGKVRVETVYVEK